MLVIFSLDFINNLIYGLSILLSTSQLLGGTPPADYYFHL